DPTDPVPYNPGDVDLYRFQISGPGRYGLTAEVFGGRIGSPLDPALSLFRYDAVTHRLEFVAANDNTFNPTHATNGPQPLFNDPVLFAGLTAGEYYLAVSASPNVPDPDHGRLPGSSGIFDPNVSHSGRVGFHIGSYVLNASLQADDTPPQVISVTPGEGAVLTQPPTQFFIQFSEPVNVDQLAFQTFDPAVPRRLDSVYIKAADGTLYFPRYDSFD